MEAIRTLGVSRGIDTFHRVALFERRGQGSYLASSLGFYPTAPLPVSLADNRRTIDIPASMSWIPGDPFGYLTIRGMVTEMAGDFRLPRDDRLNNWQLGDTVILTKGRHSARAGVQAQYLQFAGLQLERVPDLSAYRQLGELVLSRNNLTSVHELDG